MLSASLNKTFLSLSLYIYVCVCVCVCVCVSSAPLFNLPKCRIEVLGISQIVYGQGISRSGIANTNNSHVYSK